MPRPVKRRLCALLAACVLICAGEAAEAARRAPPPRAAPGSLFERQSLGFDATTIHRIHAGALSLPERLAELVREHGAALAATGAVLLLLLLVAVGYARFVRPRLAARLERAVQPAAAARAAFAGSAFAAMAQVFAAALLPAALWALHALVSDVSGSDDPVLSFVGDVLVAWTWFAIAVALLRELLLRPLLPVAAEHGRYLYRAGRLLFGYAVLGTVAIQAAWTFEVPGDVIALGYAIFELTLIALVAVILSRRRAVMALFPDVPNRLYRGFVATLDHVYFVALGVTLLTALLAWAGYVRLAHFVWIRTWALAALFLFAVFAHHALRVGIRRWIPPDAHPRESAESFYRSSTRLLDYAVVIAVVIAALDLSGLRAPLTAFFATPLMTIEERPLSVLTLVQGVAIVAAFIFVAGLLRDYLEYRIYPALGLDEGVAHAIDTSLVYIVSIIGVLAALQAVGLGIGSITVFAGALGIGVGFGLQGLAGNLASGLVLIFSRALRRGDWVKVGDTVGVIQEVGIRATRVRSRDAIEFLVPNADFVAGTIVNWTHTSPYVRVHVPLGVAYQADPNRVREILERVAAETPHVERAPAPEVWLVKFAATTIELELLVWIHMKQIDEHKVKSDLYFAIYRELTAAGIEFSSPQDVLLRKP
jgi:small-conductance mechanosensitive channel